MIHGHRTAEAEIEQKAAAAGRKLVRAMIRTTMAWALEGRIPPEMGHKAHTRMMAEYNAQRAIQEEAAAQRQAKVDRHYQDIDNRAHPSGRLQLGVASATRGRRDDARTPQAATPTGDR